MDSLPGGAVELPRATYSSFASNKAFQSAIDRSREAAIAEIGY